MVKEAKQVNKLTTHLLQHPNQNSIQQLAGIVPAGNVADFVRKHPQFFEMYDGNKRVRVKQTTSKSGYKWRMCVIRHFKGYCPKRDTCGFWHGHGDTRDQPKQGAATAPAPVMPLPANPTPVANQNNNPAPNPSRSTRRAKPTYVARTEQAAATNVSPTPSQRVFEGKTCYLVPQEKKCAEIIDELISQEMIAVDCEGVSLGTNGTLCLIQIATKTNVYVIDMCVDERDSIINTLKPIFKSATIKKILHSASNDNVALNAVGIVNENVEDTQRLFQDLLKLTRSPEKKLGLETLMQHYGFVHELKKKMKNVYKHKRNFWAQRPLTNEMIEYAACDVANLATVYMRLKGDIENYRNNPLPPQEQNLIEKTFAAALGLPVGTPLRLFFTEDKKPDRRLDGATVEEVPPEKNNTNEVNEKVRIDNEREEKTLLGLFPGEIRKEIEIEASSAGRTLIEIVLDLGRTPELIFIDGTRVELGDDIVTDMAPFVSKILASSQRNNFSRDNRIGIEGSLHRISAIKNADNRVIGLTYRIGRHFPHSAEIFTDLIARVATQNISILLLGKPGKGKTTLLREFSRLLNDEYKQRVMIIDTSNEIGGDGDIAHKCIGRARRMPVLDKASQHKTMVEAVQNHNPMVIVIDEIGTPKEAAAAKTISQRGVSLIGTAHGTSFDSLMKNPELVPLLGGFKDVVLGDKEAIKNEDGTKSKVKHERGGSPTFNVIIEIVEKNQFVIYDNVARVVDAKLNRVSYTVERRWFTEDQMYCQWEEHDSWN